MAKHILFITSFFLLASTVACAGPEGKAPADDFIKQDS